MGKIHIGKKIKEVLDGRKDLKVIDFAKKINLTRDGAYKIFEKESIASDQLEKISKVLNHDFFRYYQGNLNIVQEKSTSYGYASKEDLEELTKLVGMIAKDIDKMRKELAQLSVLKKKKNGSKKGKA